jgi:uncharacterized protein YkwD
LEAPPPPSKSHAGGIIATIVSIVIIIIIAFFVFNNLSFFSGFFNLSNTATTKQVSTIGGSNFTIVYPQDYNTLANYAVSLINRDRANFSVSTNVTLSPIASGQQHAYSMEENGYFSHWDVQGYKPYMRYTILNGTGAVEENVAFEQSSYYGAFTSLQAQENAISTLEHDMVYNDYNCCQNGHLLNIINPHHNRVSIGIMYGGSSFYFVEDFENYYFNSLNTPIFNPSNENVVLQGSTITSLNPDSVTVWYDPLPTPINTSVLNTQYQRPYDQGTFLGGAIPCSGGPLSGCNRFSSGITVTPSTWNVNSTSIDIAFSLRQFIQNNGSGVYTIYLTQNTFASNSNETEPLTSISIFVHTT